jgi:hypothetical protein
MHPERLVVDRQVAIEHHALITEHENAALDFLSRDKRGDRRIVAFDAAFEFGEFCGELSVCGQEFTELDKNPDNGD